MELHEIVARAYVQQILWVMAVVFGMLLFIILV
jgi:hypothetical protein